AVLQGEDSEVGELGDFLARGPDAEDAAGVARALLWLVTMWHVDESRAGTEGAGNPGRRDVAHGTPPGPPRAPCGRPRRPPGGGQRGRGRRRASAQDGQLVGERGRPLATVLQPAGGGGGLPAGAARRQTQP